MIADIRFLYEDIAWPVLVGSVALLVVFIWKEWQPNKRLRFFIKIFTALLLVFSLAMLALRPLKVMAPENGVVALLSEGLKSNQLDSLQKEYRDLSVIKYAVNKDIRDTLHSFGEVIILGRGIQPFDFWQLEGMPVRYLGGAHPEGLIGLWYTTEPVVGEELSIKGTFNEPRKGDRLILRGPGGTGLDSISLKEGGMQPFQLLTTSVLHGKFLFSLDLMDSMGTLKNSEPLPVRIRPESKLKIGVVNDFPTFETKYLKNFLAERGHELFIRSKVSSDRYKMEAFNTDPATSLTISEKNLETFDLLIMDSETYKKLPGTWQMAVKNAIFNTGLGLFIQGDTGFFRATGSGFEFTNDKTTMVQPDQVQLKIPKHPFHFKEGFGLQAVHTADGKVLSAYIRAGEGRIGSTVFESTFQLLLDGHQKEYQRLWAGILTGISKKNHPVAEWGIESRVIYLDQPFEFQIRTTLEQPEVIGSTGSRIPLAQDVDLFNLWQGTTYPRRKGWNHQVLKNDTAARFEYYVMDTTSWRSLAQYGIQEVNNRHWDRDPITGEGKQGVQPIPQTGFYIVFLLCAGYLWLEPRNKVFQF